MLASEFVSRYLLTKSNIWIPIKLRNVLNEQKQNGENNSKMAPWVFHATAQSPANAKACKGESGNGDKLERSPESPDLAWLIHANLAHGWEFGGIRTYQQLHVKLEVFQSLESTWVFDFDLISHFGPCQKNKGSLQSTLQIPCTWNASCASVCRAN